MLLQHNVQTETYGGEGAWLDGKNKVKSILKY